MENQANTHHYRLLMIVVFLIFAGFLAFLTISKLENKSSLVGGLITKIQPTPTPSVTITGGSLSMRIVGDNKRHPLADYLILELRADSQAIDVVGYDILLGYDTQAFELIQADSQIADFQIYKNSSPGKLTLTGAKKISSSNSNLWSGQKIVELILRPQKTGSFTFNILGQAGKEKTQLVDTQSKVYYPKLDQVQVEIF